LKNISNGSIEKTYAVEKYFKFESFLEYFLVYLVFKKSSITVWIQNFSRKNTICS